MAVCPSCNSSRIRSDYKPAPLYLRLIGIRALLCDYCNYQFRAFSLRAPKSNGRPRHTQSNAESLVLAASENTGVNLQQLRRKVAEAQSEKAESIGRIKISLRPVPTGEEVSGQSLPIHRELKTQILKLHARGGKETLEAAQTPEESLAPMPPCPECGSQKVRRRRRSAIERAALALTDHKPFNCRECGASFYAKPEDNANVGNAGLFDSPAPDV